MHGLALLIAIVCLVAAPAGAAELMPTGKQNVLIQKYCAVCHTNAARNGGLSLEHFDAAQAPPSLTAMLLSKLTSGVPLKMVLDASTNAGARALVDRKVNSGAMRAAGIPIPDKATIDALIHAFAVQSAGATDWTVERGSSLTASALQEIPRGEGDAEFYRLIASCNPATKEGYLQLAWSPVPRSGSLEASVDGRAAIRYRVEGSEAMGNGSGLVLHGPAAIMLSGLPFPAVSLTIRDLFPGETATFSFAGLPQDARQTMTACFPTDTAADRPRGSSGRAQYPR